MGDLLRCERLPNMMVTLKLGGPRPVLSAVCSRRRLPLAALLLIETGRSGQVRWATVRT